VRDSRVRNQPRNATFSANGASTTVPIARTPIVKAS
jgi:hypothetical protein